VVHEDVPVQVVDFMLEHVREPALRLQLVPLARPVLVAHLHPVEARALLPLAGDGQAALLQRHGLLLLQHLRVDDFEGRAVLAAHQRHAQRLADLIGGDADALCFLHRLGHLLQQLLERGAEVRHGLRGRGEYLVGPDDDVASHGGESAMHAWPPPRHSAHQRSSGVHPGPPGPGPEVCPRAPQPPHPAVPSSEGREPEWASTPRPVPQYPPSGPPGAARRRRA